MILSKTAKTGTIKQPAGKEFYRDVIEWDVPNWSRALDYWSRRLTAHFGSQELQGIEIGARHGGMSLYFAARHGCRMVCTDYGGPSDTAREKHVAYGVSGKIEYADVNALDVPYPDNTFDFVVFKSVLGVVAYSAEGQDKGKQARAMQEFYRILKPGGMLLFAENLRASAIHRFAREKFVPWGTKWRYVTVPEMKEFLAPFQGMEHKTFGFLGALAKGDVLKSLVYPVECLINPLVPESANYIMYGVAVK